MGKYDRCHGDIVELRRVIDADLKEDFIQDLHKGHQVQMKWHTGEPVLMTSKGNLVMMHRSVECSSLDSPSIIVAMSAGDNSSYSV
jgi:sulfatase maturation enzyme AslB (radical SAM superfamily)